MGKVFSVVEREILKKEKVVECLCGEVFPIDRYIAVREDDDESRIQYIYCPKCNRFYDNYYKDAQAVEGMIELAGFPCASCDNIVPELFYQTRIDPELTICINCLMKESIELPDRIESLEDALAFGRKQIFKYGLDNGLSPEQVKEKYGEQGDVEKL